MSEVLERIEGLKLELDTLGPLSPDVIARIRQRLRIELNYHSNAIEGNSLTLCEARSLILHGLTAQSKPLRDHIDIGGHDEASKAIEAAVNERSELNQAFIRNLHIVLLKEPYEVDAVTPDGRAIKRSIEIGSYKSRPNSVRTSTGEICFFTPPEQVKSEMGELMRWCAAQEVEDEHPIAVAATFHYRFVRIHPFDDGNGRMARLLTNMILMRHGYTVAIVRQEDRDRYIRELEHIDRTENLTEFIDYIASCCEYALDLHLRAAHGESIEEFDDIDREIAIFKKSLVRDDEACDRRAARE